MLSILLATANQTARDIPVRRLGQALYEIPHPVLLVAARKLYLANFMLASMTFPAALILCAVRCDIVGVGQWARNFWPSEATDPAGALQGVLTEIPDPQWRFAVCASDTQAYMEVIH